MMKSSTTFWNSGAYTSHGTPDYEDKNVGGVQKGWYSERVPLPLGSSKRHINSAVLSPFSSGKALPSKWDDADRWITSSPLSRNGACKPAVVQSQRRLKSKSGPLEDQVVSYSTFCSPAVPVLEGGGKNAMGFMAGSPLTTGVLVPDGLSIHYGGGIGVQVNPINAENSVAQSGNATGWTDSLSDSSLPSSRDEKPDGTKDQEVMEPLVVSRRDMATQMSPEGSQNGRLSFMASPPSDLPTVDKHRNYYAKVEVRDVQIDKKVTQIKNSIKDGATTAKKYSPDIKRLASAWDVAEEEKKMSRFEREEARISAWESLQIAKAEAAIKKLEIKLEKKRSNSMDKILYKLRKSQAKAQNLRGLKSDNAANKASKPKPKVASFRRIMTMGSLTGCFTSHTKWEGDRG